MIRILVLLFLFNNLCFPFVIFDQHITDVEIDIDELIRNQYFGDIYINLFLFYDDTLLKRFNYNVEHLKHFILSITHSVALTYNNRPLNRLARFYFIVLDIIKLNESITIDPSADGELYRQRFQKHYLNILKLNYAAAILLTGYNFRYQRNKTDTQGLANAGFIACSKPTESFIIVEARSYRAAFIMAHELGHTLNMEHDEHMETSCGPHFIMSATTGPGKTQFSICSYNKLREYLMHMSNRARKCFSSFPNKSVAILPNQLDATYKSISVNEQCQTALGETFRAKDMTFNLISVCTKIECTNEVVNIFIDPAIENTTCAVAKYCRAGHCL